MMCVIDKIFF